MDPDSRLASMGIELASPFPPVGSYVNHVHVDHLLVLGGQIPWEPPDRLVRGRLGDDLDVEQGREAARLAAVHALCSIRDALGSLGAVERVVSLRGVVNATAAFVEHTQVVDAASDLLVEVFGDRGRHARLAVGVSSLPASLALELELTLWSRFPARVPSGRDRGVG